MEYFLDVINKKRMVGMKSADNLISSVSKSFKMAATTWWLNVNTTVEIYK